MITEAQFQAQIVDLAKMSGWLVHAERPAQYQSGRWATHIQGMAGFFDLVMIRDGDVIFAELKVGKNKPSEAQNAWIDALAPALHLSRNPLMPSVRAFVWRPADMPAIQRILLTRSRIHATIRT